MTNIVDCNDVGRFMYISTTTASKSRHEITISGYSFTRCKPQPDPGQRQADGGVFKVIVAGLVVPVDLQPRLSIFDSHFYGNSAVRGGAIFVGGVGAQATLDVERPGRDDPNLRVLRLENVFFHENQQAKGTIFSVAYRIVAKNVAFWNTTGSDTAAIYMESTSSWWEDLEVKTTISLNLGPIFADLSMLNIAKLNLHDNRCRGAGTIECRASGIKLVDTQAFNNNASGSGVLYAATSLITIQNGHFYNNNAIVRGGAIGVAEESSLTLDGALIESNFAALGGGLHLAVNAEGRISNTRFLRNRANQGGAIAASHAHTVVLADVEIAENTATLGAAVFCSQSTYNLTRVKFNEPKNSMYCSEDNGGSYCKILGDTDFSAQCASSLVTHPAVADKNDGIEDPLILGLPLWAVVIISIVVGTIVCVGSFVGIVLIVRRVRGKKDTEGNSIRDAEEGDANRALWSQLPTEDDLDDEEGLQ